VSVEKFASSEEMQALWLRRVQTRSADFLKAKFAWQPNEVDGNPRENLSARVGTPLRIHHHATSPFRPSRACPEGGNQDDTGRLVLSELGHSA